MGHGMTPPPPCECGLDTCTGGVFPDCGCGYTTDDDGIHYCPLHKAAPALRDALESSNEGLMRLYVLAGFKYEDKSIESLISDNKNLLTSCREKGS